jgi:hypothetical protein
MNKQTPRSAAAIFAGSIAERSFVAFQPRPLQTLQHPLGEKQN